MIFLSFGLLSIFSCRKDNVVTSKSAVYDKQLIAGNAGLYVSKVKYNRDFIMNDNGKYDCSTSGNNCNVTKASSMQIDQLTTLDGYIAQNNTAAYFAGNKWAMIFPECTNAGIEALINKRIFLYKKESIGGVRTYVLSSATAPRAVNYDNIIAVWQFP